MEQQQDTTRKLRLVRGSAAWLQLRRGLYWWTDEEKAVLREHYPNWQVLDVLLPHRTRTACRSKKRLCCPTKHIYFWTSAEIGLLRRLYPKVGLEQPKSSFPNRNISSIRQKAHHIKLRRPQRSFRLTGNMIIDSVKLRARDKKITMRELDLHAGSGKYFRNTPQSGFVRMDAIERALDLLGGELVFKWEE